MEATSNEAREKQFREFSMMLYISSKLCIFFGAPFRCHQIKSVVYPFPSSRHSLTRRRCRLSIVDSSFFNLLPSRRFLHCPTQTRLTTPFDSHFYLRRVRERVSDEFRNHAKLLPAVWYVENEEEMLFGWLSILHTRAYKHTCIFVDVDTVFNSISFYYSSVKTRSCLLFRNPSYTSLDVPYMVIHVIFCRNK